MKLKTPNREGAGRPTGCCAQSVNCRRGMAHTPVP
jgi:hypothetical protein